ncbi:carbamoyl-phosphate synthase large subunit [Conexibacter sp. S30A1]|uniref:carbamoyl-phosphate synthase large subunit n=1 Tax=Conexibacter sp. S30A1 TaxID=2937800 RepID=UPI00200EEF43|nr:carbamoyl-phosphate synthase large subunit [Conexibacter sp. S30A1]
MPRRNDLHKILLIGSGPIVIGQAAEFDYSGTQAARVLMQEGYEVVLVNSNPATIMTDPEVATTTYVEPLDPRTVTRIIERERPDALVATLGGQTALNLAKRLHEDGVLERFGVELIGAKIDAIERGEDRDLFRATMQAAGLRVPRSAIAHTLAEARAAVAEIGLPVIIRPAFTLGGAGGGVLRDMAQFDAVIGRGLEASPISQILIDESVLGWGEFELEVMRDSTDNVVIVCAIENIDPMGVHTGDSVCVAPQQTLPDHLYQRLRDQAITVIRAIGVETGGSNVQFAVNPATEEIMVIEMNPRVSRSSALASKATGFPIAKIAARLAVGYTLQEITNDITRATPASFEPAIDYCVVKWPRFAFEKFPGAEQELTTHMKSVGEAMAIGRTFRQAFAKALRSRELDAAVSFPSDDEQLLELVAAPGAERFDHLLEALRRGHSVAALEALTQINPWFLRELEALVRDPDAVFAGQRTFKSVDTCAAEFAAQTPYFYSAWERPRPAGPDGRPLAAGEVTRGSRPSVVILGSGPNRIGQGIEFDYCCVHAAQTVRESGRDAVMINCNPETVSTDYDTSDRLYFEPLTLPDVLGVCEIERPEGVILQFGGQTPLKLAAGLRDAGIPILGTTTDAIDLAEDRARFGRLLDELGYRAPPYAAVATPEEALERAPEVGFPLLVRPSYVLGGRAMEIVYSVDGLRDYLRRVGVIGAAGADGGPRIYLDRFLEDSVEVDVDALCDGERVWIAGIMQHVEEAGIHSGDSACVLPPHSLGDEMLEQIREQAAGIARALGVVGLLNVQFAIHAGSGLHVIEANPRASRTVPFVSKAIGLPVAKLACRLMLGTKLDELDLPDEVATGHVCVKEAVLPFDRFAGTDALLGPEMRSTGEVMGIARDFPTAFAKAQAAAGARLPRSGTVFVSVADRDKSAATAIATQIHDMGFELLATSGTAKALARMGIPARRVNKLSEGSPHVVEAIGRGEVDLVINTPVGTGARSDGYEIRAAAVAHRIPCITTMSGAIAAIRAIAAATHGEPEVISLQELYAQPRAGL